MAKETLTKKKIEHKLIQEFMNNFYEKVGYYPTVVTRENSIENRDGLKILSLEELKECFEPFMPDYFGKKLTLFSKCRLRPLVELRFMFFFVARCMRYNLSDIGFYFNKMHHTSIIHGITTFRSLYETNENFKNRYHQIINHIKQKHESPVVDYIDQE
jgi:hypothetical protein